MSRIRFFIFFTCTFILLGADASAQKGKSKTKEKSSSYDVQGPFCCGLARVKKDHKWGYIDTTGNIVIPIKYQEVENFSENLARVRQGRKWGLYDNTGKEIIKPTFDYIGPFVNGKAKVLIEAEEYYMNTEGVRVAP
jgi:hypothetical protein